MEEEAVTVRDACKGYFGNEVLRGLNMTVQAGSIYSLLGASGCGKTTLLSCILGLQRLNSGTIHLAIDKFKDVGYMPQDISLQTEFTIGEALHFYGLMFGLEEKLINKTAQFYLNLFELPSLNTLISSLSGGQQRRVSLAVSLFHDPKLIILDEPTVGLDPIIKEKVWDHLKHLAHHSQKTIIITTHYIQEAATSNMVAFMRSGVVLEEDEPTVLLEKMECSTLDEVFLKLCYKDTETDQRLSNSTRVPSSSKHSSQLHDQTESSMLQDGYLKHRRFTAQLVSNFIKLKRSLWALLFIPLLPAMYAWVTWTYVHLTLDVRVGYYSEEARPGSCGYESAPLSCALLEHLRGNFTVVEYGDEESGVEDVRANRTRFFLHVGSNFTRAIAQRVSNGFATTDEELHMSDLDVYLKPRIDFFDKLHVLICLRQSLEVTMKRLLRSWNLTDNFSIIPLKITPVHFAEENFSANSEIVSFTSGVLLYLGMLFTSTLLFEETSNGVLARNKVTGLTEVEVTSALLLVQLVVMIVQSSIMLTVVYHVIGFYILGNNLLTLAILVFQGMLGSALGILWTKLAPNYMILAYFILGYILSVMFLTGTAWPVAGQWWLLRKVSWLVPSALAVESLRGVILKGLDLHHPSVYRGLLSNTAWLLLTLLSVLLISRTKR